LLDKVLFFIIILLLGVAINVIPSGSSVVVQSASSNHTFNNDHGNDFNISVVEKLSDSDQPPGMISLHTYNVILLLDFFFLMVCTFYTYFQL